MELLAEQLHDDPSSAPSGSAPRWPALSLWRWYAIVPTTTLIDPG